MKKYIEEDLRKAFEAGSSYGSHDSYFDKPLDEDEYIDSLKEKVEKDNETIPITYGLIKATCGWSKFAEVCDKNVYAINEYGDYEPNEVFYITEIQAKQLNFI